MGGRLRMKSKKLLPPLDYFVAFETAAKCGSFAQAARQMNISENSISRKVRLLELHYDVPLFVRGHRSVHLTAHGQNLLDTVTVSLDGLRKASQQILSRKQKNAVTIAATNSVASLWLMPRLRQFNRTNSRIKIILLASDSDEECLAENVDLAILRGDGEWPGHTATMLFGETIFPVCSESYLRANPTANDLSELPNLDLIDISSMHTEWMNWESWLSAQGISEQPMRGVNTFNTYPLGIQAAVDGLGLALGWGHLVDHHLDSGALFRPMGDRCVRTESGYFLLKRKGQTAFAEQKIVEDWLLKESASRRRYEPHIGA